MKFYISFIVLFFSFQAPAFGVNIEELNYFDAINAIKSKPLTVVAIASDLKVHGPHLPLNTDQILATRIKKDLAQKMDVAVMPILSIGWYPQFANFEVANYSAETTMKVTRDFLEGIIRSGAKRILILNFDVEKGSGAPITIVMSELRQKHPIPMLLMSWYDFVDESVTKHLTSFAGHADELETSLMLFLDESKVQKSRIIDVPDLKTNVYALKGRFPMVFDRPNQNSAFSIPGQLGMAKLATKEKGEKIYQQILLNIESSCRELIKVKL